MKKIWIYLSVIIAYISPVFADYWLNFEQFLNAYVQVVEQDKKISDNYSYIKLKYSNIVEWTKIYDTLQKAVYIDLMPNVDIQLPISQQITQEIASKIISRNFDINISVEENTYVSFDRLIDVLTEINQSKFRYNKINYSNDNLTENPLFLDVYNRLNDYYIWHTWFDEKILLHGSVKWFVESLKDPYTSFFSSTEANNVWDELTSEYYGIWSHVEMIVPWNLIIVSPMKWSPSEKAWLLAWDKIIKIDNKIIDDKISLNDAVFLIKWPAWTVVKIKIIRNSQIFDFSIVREKIKINNLDFKTYDQKGESVCIVNISMFDFDISNSFNDMLNKLSKNKCKKYIFDVRNNPGWSLSEVVNILDYFVNSGNTLVTIKSKSMVEDVVASDKVILDIDNIPVRVLVDKWSASASEIFAWVIRDYLKKALIVWEKTFWKWSVQEIFNYNNGSMLKYTIAKWYTWKSKTNIDKIGILPDITVSDKIDTIEDEVLEWAINN